MIIAEKITKSFGDLQVLKGIDVEIRESEIVSIVGPSGAGKTTFLQILGTLSKPTSGILKIHDIEVHNLKDNEIAKFRNNRIGFVFQFHHLLPEFTAFENVCIPGYLGNHNTKKIEERAHELLGHLGLSHREKHKPAEMSGGEQQRVAVARALINNPDIVLADEPSGNLDFQSKKDLHNLFFELRDNFGHTFVIVTHNEDLAHMSDRMLTIVDGRIIDEDYIP